ncbi:hypothetical protein Tco_0999707 [Tanacetum coccineum]
MENRLRNKCFPEKIASNLKFLNNLQPEWSRHVTIVHQTKDFHTADYTQLYDFLKYNQKEVDDLRAERLAKIHDPLALMANSNSPYNFPVFHQDQPSPSTYMQQPLLNNNIIPQPSFNQNYMQQPMKIPEDIIDPTTAMNMALALMAKAFKLNYLTPTNNNQRISSNLRNRQIAQPGMNMGQDRQIQMVGGIGGNQFRQYAGQNVGKQNGYNAVQNVRNQVVQNAVQNLGVQNVGNQNGLMVVPGIANQNQNRNGNVVAARAQGNANENNGNQIRCYNCRGLGHFARKRTEEARIQLQAEEFNLMDAAGDPDEIDEVNANCILMANLQQASTSGTQTNMAPVYDSDRSAELHNYDNCYNNEIFNINVVSDVPTVEQNGDVIEQSPATVEETRALCESLYNNLAIEVEKVNSVNPQQKQQSLYNGNVLLEKHDPPAVYDSEETLKRKRTQQRAQDRDSQNFKRKNFSLTPTQVDADYFQNFEIQFLREAAKFVRDFKSLANEADESLDKQKTLELEIERLLRAVVSHEIMSIVQSNSVIDTSNLQTELERTKERFENCIIKKENEYAKLWNDWYKKCEECKYDKISYDKAYNDMQQKIERLQAQLGDLKGKSKDTSCASDTLDPLSQKLENENVELEFQVVNYVREIEHLKTTYKNLFDSISVTRAQTKSIIDSLQDKLHNMIYENVKLRA